MVDDEDVDSEEVGESWISEWIVVSYLYLYELGYVYLIECWCDGCLVGGFYGVGIGCVFCGESMFSCEVDVFKVVLVWLVVVLCCGGVWLFDC